ncbi:MAG: hypothetical protein LUI04_04480 [Porphyromonadaceae bacterium]|nr:hypothetical protein [Porphyromonadaceae bacterium]
MKKLFLFAILLAISMNLLAQNDVTRFLGIPVDGSKAEMIQKLKEKGFVNSKTIDDTLVGEFNGTQVNVSVVTTNNKVSRIVLYDAIPSDETSIKIRFNKLCRQFKNNDKYISLEDYTIPDDEKISYEMTAHNKRYEAIFYQQPESVDSAALVNEVLAILLQKYPEKELENLTEEMQKDIVATAGMILISKKPVWFMISCYYGEYFISMYYDNEYNRANGEDL